MMPRTAPLTARCTRLGSGFSTPSVVGDRLYLLNNEGLQNEYVRALNVSDGKTVWSTRIGKVGNRSRQFQHTVKGSGREMELLHGCLQQFLS